MGSNSKEWVAALSGLPIGFSNWHPRGHFPKYENTLELRVHGLKFQTIPDFNKLPRALIGKFYIYAAFYNICVNL